MASNEGEVDLPKVIDKIRKLFALGQSPNENEAAAAVAMAQKMLAQYDLTMESVENLKSDKRTSITKGQSVMQTVEGKPDGWKADLFQAVADSSDVFTAYTYDSDLTPSGKRRTIRKGGLIGFAHDVEVAGYAFSFLVHEIERLAQAYADVMWAQIRQIEREQGVTHQDAEKWFVQNTGRHPLKAKLYFTKGAAETVARKLRDEYLRRRDEAARANPHAIVLSKKQAISDHLHYERYGKTRAQSEAEWAERQRKWQQEHPEAQAVVKHEPVETEAQRRKRLEREERESNRYWDRQDRERQRREAAMDKDAYRAGRTTGESISVRPGVGAGKKVGELS